MAVYREKTHFRGIEYSSHVRPFFISALFDSAVFIVKKSQSVYPLNYLNIT